MLPWTLVVLLAVALGLVVYRQIDTAVSVDHLSQQLGVVTDQRDVLKILIESQSPVFTKGDVEKVLVQHSLEMSPSGSDDLLIVGSTGLRFEGGHLKDVELE